MNAKVIFTSLAVLVLIGGAGYFMMPAAEEPEQEELASIDGACVEVYYKPACGYCKKAFRLLKKHKADYVIYNLERRTDLIPEMMQRTRNAQTVPQIFIAGKHIGGYTELLALSKQKKLKEKLKMCG
ncbi:MAG: glutaredoxin domain-containing protein [Alphaproteobacteria bacterium]